MSGNSLSRILWKPVTFVKDGHWSKLIAHFGQQIIFKNRDEERQDHCKNYWLTAILKTVISSTSQPMDIKYNRLYYRKRFAKKKIKKHLINIKKYIQHTPILNMVHVPTKFREKTAMRFRVPVRKLNMTDIQTDWQTDGAHINISHSGPSNGGRYKVLRKHSNAYSS